MKIKKCPFLCIKFSNNEFSEYKLVVAFFLSQTGELSS